MYCPFVDLILTFLNMHIMDLFVQITFSIKKPPKSTKNFV